VRLYALITGIRGAIGRWPTTSGGRARSAPRRLPPSDDPGVEAPGPGPGHGPASAPSRSISPMPTAACSKPSTTPTAGSRSASRGPAWRR